MSDSQGYQSFGFHHEKHEDWVQLCYIVHIPDDSNRIIGCLGMAERGRKRVGSRGRSDLDCYLLSDCIISS
jgi:hypothetical protein